MLIDLEKVEKEVCPTKSKKIIVFYPLKGRMQLFAYNTGVPC